MVDGGVIWKLKALYEYHKAMAREIEALHEAMISGDRDKVRLIERENDAVLNRPLAKTDTSMRIATAAFLRDIIKEYRQSNKRR